MENESETPAVTSSLHREKIGKALYFVAKAYAVILILFLSIGCILYGEMERTLQIRYHLFFLFSSMIFHVTAFLFAASAHLTLPKHSRLRTPTSRFTIFLAFGFFFFFSVVPGIMPSSQGSIRSIVSIVKTDMRSLAIALESYYTDNQSYPPSTLDPSKRVPFNSNISLPTFSLEGANLTTPVNYYSARLPVDHLAVDWKPRSSSTYAYWNADNKGWILLSPGPDGVFDIDFETLQKLYDPSQSEQPSRDLIARMYDASNGTISSGDIMRVKM